MDTISRLKRVTDLFVEGAEVYLGDDDEGKPVLIWVNKLNSFEIEEARRDGVARRGERMAELGKPDNPERAGLVAEMGLWSDEQLQHAWVAQKIDEVYLEVIDDLETQSEWREKLERMRRLPQILDDSNVPLDDPRRAEIQALQTEYMEALSAGQEEKHHELLRDAADQSREDLERDYIEKWRQRMSLDEFMEERRTTELFIAMRECAGTRKGEDSQGRPTWDHTDCNHAARLLPDRKALRGLPEPVIEKVIDAVDSLRVSQREAGNSGAPASSSGSSGPQSVQAEDSTRSTPDATPSGAPTT